MFNSKILNIYISTEFIKIIFNVAFGCFCLGTTMNLLEEINFFKDYDVGIMIPFYASILKVPNLIFIMSPFIILFSTVWLFLKIIKSGEMVIIKVSGFSNLTLILIPSLVAFIFGILIIIGFNPLTAALTKSYYDLKADYSKSNDYMASVTINGIWIKEKNSNKTSIIRSLNLKEDTLLNVSIYQFDESFKSTMRIEAKEANIKNKNWILKNVRVGRKGISLVLIKLILATYYLILQYDYAIFEYAACCC